MKLLTKKWCSEGYFLGFGCPKDAFAKTMGLGDVFTPNILRKLHLSKRFYPYILGCFIFAIYAWMCYDRFLENEKLEKVGS